MVTRFCGFQRIGGFIRLPSAIVYSGGAFTKPGTHSGHSIKDRSEIMKLYYSPGACSLAPHIVLRETGSPFELVKVDLAARTTETGDDFSSINPHGYVPALELDSKEVLTEGVAIMQYIADRFPEKRLAPENGTLARARLQERLNFITTELHKAFVPLFDESPDDAKQRAVEAIKQKLDFIDQLLEEREYLVGEGFSIADAYLFVVISWAEPTGIGLDNWPNIKGFSRKVAGRESVQNAMRAEGLLN